MSLLSRLAVQAARAYGILSAADKTKVTADFLVVAGGGGAGDDLGGAGGAGGFRTSAGTSGGGASAESKLTLSTLNTYSITVGAGGAGATTGGVVGTNGGDSSISGTGLSTITSLGGGGGAGDGGGSGVGTPNSGGSGGAAASGSGRAGAAGTANQGFAGGSNPAGTYQGASAGGGGAGAAGTGRSGSASIGGNGGNGVASSISGSSVTYAGGGAGGTGTGGTAGTAGLGGGGTGSTGSGNNGGNGGTNLGGGGGGGSASGANGGSGGSGIVIISYTSATPKFVGGTLTTSGGNQIHTFTSSGTLSPLTPVTASYLVVAGGGGAGAANGGGGGAGGLLTNSTTLYSGATYVVTVGAGGGGGAHATGTGATNGGNSVLSGTGITTITATGGGRGGSYAEAAASGGSGGGASNGTNTGGTGTSGQGNNGGSTTSTQSGNYPAAGGGGAGAAGANVTGGSSNASNGGIGLTSSITGTSTYYAGGGGGGANGGSNSSGGLGGGGGGSVNAAGIAGTPNTGGGGGGSAGSNNGATGGSGIVIISYAGSQQFNGGLVTSSGGNTIHTFTATGALTPLTNNLTNSLRFRASASAQLTRTPTLAGNNTKMTFSFWTKRGELSKAFQNLFTSGASAGNGDATIFTSGDAFRFWLNGGSSGDITTSQVFRDPSAWYHIVVAIDTTQATSSNRVKIYVNGNQVTAFSSATYPNQNYAIASFNTTTQQQIGYGVTTGSGGNYFDGYMTDINFIDGQQLEPYYFGNNDANGVWKPIKYTGMYGTNGFYLTFGNTTSTTTLGYDSSPNGNNWTTNNISLTAGTTYDAMTDVPTNTSATVANFSVFNSLIPSSVSGSAVRSISAGNLYVTNSGPNGWSAIGTTMVMTSGSGKWYWEVTCSGTTSNGTMIGIHRPFTSTATFPSAILGYDTPPDPDGYGYYMGGNKYNNSGAGVAYGASYTAGDVIGVALDMSTAGSASITFYKNNTSQGVAFSSLTGDFFAAVSQAQSNGLDINFGQRPFSYTPPTGFVALNTFNLPTPTILQGNRYMDATLYTGNSSTQVIVNNAQFKPDVMWIKTRSAGAYNHHLIDSVRGVTKNLRPNLTAAEDTTTDQVTAINSNGFTLGKDTAGPADSEVNVNGNTYVGWQWQAGQGSTSSNTSGSITSTASVNTTAGFSIVTYTGTGANATVGHGLGVAPSMIIIKRRNGVTDWATYHASVGNTKALFLNRTLAADTSASYWNNTTPSSTVFTVGTGADVNPSSGTMVAYCWAEIAGFSKAFSYTGNGNADGSFVYLGFRPKFIMIKSSAGVADDWSITDTSRSTYNLCAASLRPNTSGAEDTNVGVGRVNLDILSNGFKLRQSSDIANGNGFTYIGMAFAENPFKNANAR